MSVSSYRVPIVAALSLAAATVSAGSAAVAQSGSGRAHLSVEGGSACSNNEDFVANGFYSIGSGGCGWTGAIELGRTGAPVFSLFDHWAVRARFTRFADDTSYINDSLRRVDIDLVDRRMVLDAEVGTKLPFALFGGTSRIVVGLRYARWTGDLSGRDTAGNSESFNYETSGLGPRLGLRSAIPLGTHFMLESQTGAAALFSTHEFSVTANGIALGSISQRHTTYSIDSSTALSYKLNGTEAGPVASVGLFSEYWFNQIEIRGTATFDRNRHSWGPFARLRVPLQ
jgi:hypothetical protein